MIDLMGPGKLVRHMQSPPYASEYVIALGTSFDSQNSKNICRAGHLLYMYLSAENAQTV